MNLYGFVGNDGINEWDRLGQYASKDQALRAARDAVGGKSTESRLRGIDQVFGHLPKPPKTGNPGPLNASDAVLHWVTEVQPPHFLHGVAGVEYSSTVYCCPDRIGDKYNFTEPLGGRLPSEDEMRDGLYGSVQKSAWPEGCSPVAFLHSHTFARLWMNSDGALSSPTHFLPDNSGPSREDIAFKADGIEEYLVHEHVGVYFLVRF